MATFLKIQTVNERDINSNVKSNEAGVLTFTEKSIYLGIGNKKVKYSGNTVAGGGGGTGDLTYLGDFTNDAEAIALNTENGLFYNSTEGALKIIQNSQAVLIIKGGVSANDLQQIQNALNANINQKANSSDVYLKTQVYTKNEIDTKITEVGNANKAEVLAKIDEEKQRAETKEGELKAEIEAKTKAVYYQKDIELKANDFVIHANKIYLVTKAFTTTDSFETDKANLFDLADSMSSNIALVEYAAGISIHNGQQVLKDGKLYVCKADIETTTDWDTDSVNMVDIGSTIDLTDYYNKAAIDSLLNNKMDLLTQGEGVAIVKTDNTITVGADMTKDATAEKIAQRDAEGALYAKMPTANNDDAVINYGLFKLTEQKIADNTANINSLLKKLEGKVDDYFTLPRQLLIIGGEGVKKPINFETNIPLDEIIVTWDKADKILLDLENKEFSSILAPVEADYPIKAELTRASSNQTIVELVFNYDELGAKPSTSDYKLKDYKTYTIMLNMSLAATNPKGCITAMDDCVGKSQDEIMEFLGITPVVLDGFGKEKFKLNPNDYTQQNNGTPADRPLGNDTMVKFPIRGVKLWKVGTMYFMSITDDPNAEERGYNYIYFYNGTKKGTEFYVGAYEAYENSSKLYSYPDVMPKVNTTLTTFRNLARARGTGYQLVDAYMIDYIQACYLMVIQSLNSQGSVGNGASTGAAIKTGGSDKWGMNSENGPEDRFTVKNKNVKCLGIEDLWANVWDWVDGMYIDNQYYICKSSFPDNFNDTGSGYDKLGIGVGWGSSNGNLGYISNVAWDDKLHFYPTAVRNGTADKFFCDGLWQLTDKCARFGGSFSDDALDGVFCWVLDRAASHSSGHIGSRLAYRR